MEVGDEGGMDDDPLREITDYVEVSPAELLDGAAGADEENGVEDDGEGADGGADGEHPGGGNGAGAGAGGGSGGGGGAGGGGGGNLKPTQMTLVVLHDGHRFSIFRLVDGPETDIAAAADGDNDDAHEDDEDPPEPPPQATRTSENRYEDHVPLHLMPTFKSLLQSSALEAIVRDVDCGGSEVGATTV